MDITLYSTHCPKCTVIEKKLGIKNIPYTICDDLEVMKAKGFMSAPVLEIDGKIYKFKEANDWINQQ